jgi:hypothetical protein
MKRGEERDLNIVRILQKTGMLARVSDLDVAGAPGGRSQTQTAGCSGNIQTVAQQSPKSSSSRPNFRREAYHKGRTLRPKDELIQALAMLAFAVTPLREPVKLLWGELQ